MTKARQFGHYELISRLGRGGMGEVWRARHKMLDRQAAVKLIRPDALATESGADVEALLRRFEREAQATSTLKSPHTIEIYDFGITDDGTFYYAMELLEGLDLQTLVDRYGPVPSERVIYILLQVCDSLAEAHHHELIHRDLKPANIFLTRLGLKHDFVKVLDFGLVKSTGGLGSEDKQLTMTGMITGSPAFMSPEGIKGGATDEKADIYSLGCVAYWLLTGRLVFEVQTIAEALAAHLERPPPPPSTVTELEIPAELEQIVMACLKKERGTRPPSAQALSRQLIECPAKQPWDEDRAQDWWRICRPLEVADEVEGNEEVPPTTRPVRPRAFSLERPTRPSDAGSRRRLLISGAIMTLVVAVAGIWFVGNKDLDFAVEWLSWEQRPGGESTGIQALAVLPLRNLMGDAEQDYFVDGMHDALIAELAQIEALTVISRTSVQRYRDTELSISEIAAELNVDAIVEGSVLRADNQVRITAQLVGVSPERHLWVEVYDGEMRDILSLQSQVATAVAREIRVTVTPEEQARLGRTRPVDPVVYTQYLRGRHLCNSNVEEQLRRGIGMLSDAIARDSTYAPAYAGLARCYSTLGLFSYLPPAEWFPPAETAVSKALELDEALGEAHASLGYMRLLFKWDWSGPKRDFDRALELEPNNVSSLLYQGWYLTVTGRRDAAREAYDRAMELDPLSSSTAMERAWSSFMARRFDESVRQLEELLELDPHYAYAHLWLAVNYVKKGMYAEAFTKAKEVEAIIPESEDQNSLGVLGWIYGAVGQ